MLLNSAKPAYSGRSLNSPFYLIKVHANERVEQKRWKNSERVSNFLHLHMEQLSTKRDPFS